MNSSKGKYLIYTIIFLVIVTLSTWKPLAFVSQTNEADQNSLHIRKVFNNSTIGQTATVSTGYISGIELKINKKALPENTPIQLLIKNQKNDKVSLRQVNTTLVNATQGDKLIFNFKPLNKSNFYFELAAPTLNEKDCIALRYQIDSEKYPNNQTFINGSPVYGDLAFSTLSKPPVIFLLASYLVKHPTIVLAMILFVIAIFTSRMKIPQTPEADNHSIIFSKKWPQIIFIFVFTFLSFAPLLNLYFRQDDFVILDRARTLLAEKPLLLLTNRGFVEASRSDLPVHIAFYRPISNSIIPAFLYKIFGLNAFFHYAFNYLVHSLSAIGVYLIFRHFLNKKISLLFTILWATHLAVITTVSWLSSIQELLSALFFIYSLLTLSRFWENHNIKYWAFSASLFVLAILSKENSFLFIIIAPLFLLATKPTVTTLQQKVKQIGHYLTPHIFAAALILVIRDWMLNEQGLRAAFTDTSYQISANPLVILGNLSASLTWSIQSWILSLIPYNTDIQKYLIKIEEPTGWMHTPPLIILTIIFIMIIFVGISIIKNKIQQWWFPVVFYLFMSLPFIILLNERQERWLYFPLIGLFLLIGLAIQNWKSLNSILQNNFILGILILLIIIESQWALGKNPNILEAKRQSNFTRQAITFLKNNYPSIPNSTEIIISNTPKSRQQNLGYAAIPLIYNNSTLTNSYPDDLPQIKFNDKIYLIFSEENNSLQSAPH